MQSPFNWLDQWSNESDASFDIHLTTVNEMGQPSTQRIDRLHYPSTPGVIVFGAHKESRPAYNIWRNPHVVLTLYWQNKGRSACIEGVAYAMHDEAADTCFELLPSNQKLALHIHKPISPIESLDVVHEQLAHVATIYGDGVIPRPANFGVWCVQPSLIELTECDPFFIHARHLFTQNPDGEWIYELLNP